MKFFLFILLLTLPLVDGCAGRRPNPVQIVQIDDENKSCEEIDSELNTLSKEIWKKYPEIKGTQDYNLGVGLIGSLFPPLIPFSIFSDIRKADAVEINSLQRRHNYLVETERRLGCGYEHSLVSVRKVNTILP